MNSVFRLITIPWCITIISLVNGCYSHHIYCQPRAEFENSDNRLSSTPDSSVTAWTFFWGVVDANNELMPRDGKAMKSVKIRSNIWTGMITILTAGIVRPKVIEWWHAKQTPTTGSIDTSSAQLTTVTDRE